MVPVHDNRVAEEERKNNEKEDFDKTDKEEVMETEKKEEEEDQKELFEEMESEKKKEDNYNNDGKDEEDKNDVEEEKENKDKEKKDDEERETEKPVDKSRELEEDDVLEGTHGMRQSMSTENIADNKEKEDEEKQKDQASEYLQTTVGDTLTEVLADCATTRPDDPVAFLADALDKKAKTAAKKKDNTENWLDEEEEKERKSGLADSLGSSYSSPNMSLAGVRAKEDMESPKRRKKKTKIPQRKDSPEKPRAEISSAPVNTTSKPGSSSSTFSYNQINDRRSKSLTTPKSRVGKEGNEEEGGKEVLEVKEGKEGKPVRRRKKKVPTVSMTAEQYRAKRGISNNAAAKKTGEKSPAASGKDRNGQNVSILVEDFDLEKHMQRTRKMTDSKA